MPEIKNPPRLSLFPIKDEEVWTAYKKHQASNWTAEEIDLSDDIKDWKRLTDNEKDFLKVVLAFFNSADMLVNYNLSDNFIQELDTPEIKAFYGFQYAIENVHSETYSLLIDTYITDRQEKSDLFNAINIKRFDSIKKKADWVTKYMNNDLSLPERLFAFVLVEGLQFSASFCAIFWFKKRGLMPGLSFANELISRDEGLHTEFSALMFKRNNKGRVDTAKAHSIVYECVAIEREFVREALQVGLIGMNETLMCQYVEFVADHMLTLCGFETLYKSPNPFGWMEAISLLGKTNFFEKRVGEYQKSNVMTTPSEREFCLDASF